MKIKIKVCGLTSVSQIEELTHLPVEYAGMIFYNKSPRFVEGKITGDELRAVSEKIKLVGVFVNEPLSSVKQKIEEFHLDAVQLCGEETTEDCDYLRNIVEVFKVIPVYDKEKTEALIRIYRGHCDFFLFDTQSAKYGGTGEKFEWAQLKRMKIQHFFFLSGGIAEGDAMAIRSFREAHFYGVDINSRFETSPGVKDISKIKNFISQLSIR